MPKSLIDATKKDKYQMLILDNLMEQVAEINEENEGDVRFTSLDMAYAYGQPELHPDTTRHCNFQNLGAEQRVHKLVTPDTTS